MTTAPTYSELINEIIKVHGQGDQKFQWTMADHYDGLAPRAAHRFWDALEVRKPGGTLSDVVAAWSKDELRVLWVELVWAPIRDRSREQTP